MQEKPSFIEEARRRQIVDAAIRIIAEKGLDQASLVEIARQAGCSKGVISYHFDGKDDLMEQILLRLLHEPADHVKTRVDACDTSPAKLQAYVDANFDFMRSHRNYYVALVDLWSSRENSKGQNHFRAAAYEPSRKYICRIVESGIEAGQLRDVSATTLASVVQGAIDGVMLQWVIDPDAIDLERCKREINDMISGHVRRSGAEDRAVTLAEQVKP